MIVGFDIETTHLKGNMGHILCAVAVPMRPDGTRGRPKVWRIDKLPGFGKTPDSYVNDKALVVDIVDYLSNTAQIVITHYGTYFDIPFVNTRALYWKTNPLPPIAHLDLWKTARKGLCLTSNRQATVNDLIDADHNKYKPGWAVWRKAQYGDKPAMNTLTKYCINDVQGLLDNYVALRPIMQHHPYWVQGRRTEPNASCPACGSTEVHARGWRRTKRQRIQRIHCQSCGSWSDGTRETV